MKLAALLAVACLMAQAQTTLKSAYQGLFRNGAAVNQTQFEERDQRGTPIIAAQFSSISSKHVLKPSPVHPAKDSYNFDLLPEPGTMLVTQSHDRTS